ADSRPRAGAVPGGPRPDFDELRSNLHRCATSESCVLSPSRTASRTLASPASRGLRRWSTAMFRLRLLDVPPKVTPSSGVIVLENLRGPKARKKASHMPGVRQICPRVRPEPTQGVQQCAHAQSSQQVCWHSYPLRPRCSDPLPLRLSALVRPLP